MAWHGMAWHGMASRQITSHVHELGLQDTENVLVPKQQAWEISRADLFSLFGRVFSRKFCGDRRFAETRTYQVNPIARFPRNSHEKHTIVVPLAPHA